MKTVTALALACVFAGAMCAQAPLAVPAQPPSDAEQQDLMKAVTEAANSTVDMIRVLEAYLKKYPESVQRLEIDRTLAKAAVDTHDDARIVEYGERVLAATPDDVLMLDRVSQSLVILAGEDNARKALKYARSLEDLISAMEPPAGPSAPQLQDGRDQALGRTLVTQARARILLDQNEDAERLARRAFSAYPSEETARVWANTLFLLGREPDAAAHLAEAFAIPDAHATETQRLNDRLRLGELYTKQHGSEKGMGDEILAAYDRTSTLMETRRKKLLALDPNSAASDPTQFIITGLDDKKLQMSSLAGNVLVLDFWATWCVPCRAQHPIYEAVKKHYADRRDIVFLNLDTDEDHTLVAPFLAEQMWDTHVYFEDGMSRLLQVSKIPTTVLLDKQGRVSSKMEGFQPDKFEQQLIERIDAALSTATTAAK
jgi:thiol-disulfide isomerase/thioredoxin